MSKLTDSANFFIHIFLGSFAMLVFIPAATFEMIAFSGIFRGTFPDVAGLSKGVQSYSFSLATLALLGSWVWASRMISYAAHYQMSLLLSPLLDGDS